MAKNVAPVAGLTAAHADMLDFLSQPHGALFNMAMQYAENLGIKRDQVSYIGISLAAVYLIFGSAARLFCNIIGFGYPMYASVKAIRSKGTDDLNMWLFYWTCFAVLCLVDFFSETIISFFPLYFVFKSVFLAYLFLPQTRGSEYFYDLLRMDQRTGWNDLPVEMMCEVIKHLNIKSRAQLRATARLEKAVVDSNKMKVKKATIAASRNGLAVWINNKRFDGSIERMTFLVNVIFKAFKVEVLQVFAAPHEANYWKAFLQNISEGGNFKFPIVDLHHEHSESEQDFHFFFKVCAPGTKRIHFFKAPEQGFRKVLQDNTTKHVMLGATVLQFNTAEQDVPLATEVVKAWLQNDQTIGKKMICLLGGYKDETEWMRDYQPLEDQLLTDFKNQFGGRVVEDKEKSVRIRMDDESKHIVIRILHEDDENEIEVVVVWEVIRADLAEDQFKKTSGQVYVPC